MKHIIFPLILLASPAFAADPAPKAPPSPTTCGKTVDECEKVVADLREALADARASEAGAKQQRDAAQSASYDTALSVFVSQQRAARAAAAKASPK